jgi:hypothetical protein
MGPTADEDADGSEMVGREGVSGAEDESGEEEQRR